MTGLLARLRALFRPSTTVEEIDEELRGHYEREIARATDTGMSRVDAERHARRVLGSITAHREAAVDAYGWTWLSQFRQDVRYAVRGLRRAPSFTLAAVLSLGIGIGANTAILTALDALLFRKLSVANPESLVTLEQRASDGRPMYNYGFVDYERFRALTSVFDGMFATAWADGFDVRADGPGGDIDRTQTRISVVTGNMFEVLGIRARAGRLFSESDDVVEGGHPVVVISDAYWRRRFDRAPDVTSRTLTILGTRYNIVGVAPKAFQGDWVGWPTDLWIPVAMARQVFAANAAARGAGRQYKIMARLRQGVSAAQAQAAGTVVHSRISSERPFGSGVDKNARFVVVSAASGYSRQRETFSQPLTLLLGAATIILMIACANVANLLLARTAAREREMAIRLSIGASRGRIVRQLLTESIVLALLGGLAGVCLAQLGTSALGSFGRAGPVSSVTFGASGVILDLEPNLRILAFSAVTCLVIGVLFGIAPAYRSSRLAAGVRAASEVVSLRRRSPWLDLRHVLVVAQVSMSLVLLVGATLFVRTLVNLRSAPLGYDKERLLFVWTLPGYGGRPRSELLALFSDLERRISSLPGVASASASVAGMLGEGSSGGAPLRAEGSDPATRVVTLNQMNVGTSFFSTVGQRVIAGRTFSSLDGDSTPRVVIIDERLGARLFGNENPLGRRIIVGAGANAPLFVVVGVVSNAKVASPRDSGGMVAYFPYAQSRNLSRLCLVVRLSGAPHDVAQRIRAELQSSAPSLPILRIDTADEQLDDALFRDRLITDVATFFAAVALLLACVGLYGLTAYTVARRTHEVGIRIALGATVTGVLALMLRRSMTMVTVGAALGLLGCLGLGRLVGSRLYGVEAFDLKTLIGASALLAAVTAIACGIPAGRAARVNPVTALRAD